MEYVARKSSGCKAQTAAGLVAGEDLQRRRRCFAGNPSARQQTATLVVARLAQAASMGCGRRLDRDGLLPCVPHEKIVNRFYPQQHNEHLDPDTDTPAADAPQAAPRPTASRSSARRTSSKSACAARWARPSCSTT